MIGFRRFLVACLGVVVPVVLAAGAAEARTPRPHPQARVITATYRTPAKPHRHHTLHASRHTRTHLAQLRRRPLSSGS